ncbi:MAG: DUF2958 domain-containing protein [Acidiphilium sp.]|nr:DUF2958 domain-containing protein [Acidiphilium sp.]
MNLFTKHQKAIMIENGRKSAAGEEIDPFPVVKLFLPGSGMTWLLTELDPDDEDRAFGLCDLGMGCPELGYVSLSELRSVRSRMRLGVERDQGFDACKPLSAYTEEARQKQMILA